jgi:hypothetical protein
LLKAYLLLQETTDLWQNALEYLGKNHKDPAFISLQANLACAAFVLGDHDYALSQMNWLGEIAKKEELNEILWRIYLLKGELLYSLNEADPNAENAFLQSASLLETLNPDKYRSHPMISAQKKRLYQLLIQIALQKGKKAEAFELVERYTGLRFLELTAQKEFPIKGEWRKSYWSEGGGNINFFRREKGCLEAELRRPGLKPKQKILLADSLRHIQIECDSALTQVQREDPEFASLFSVCPISLEKLQAILEEGELLLRLYELEDGYHCCAINRDEIFDYNISLKKDSVSSIICEINNHQLSSQRNNEFSDIILQPISSLIASSSVLIIVPDGELEKLSFENLLWNGEVLSKKYAISYAPSASFIQYALNKRRVFGKRLLCVNTEIDSLKLKEDFELIKVNSFSTAEEFFQSAGRNDFALVKADFKVSTEPTLNVGFFLAGSKQSPVEIRCYNLFNSNLQLTLMILDAIDANTEGGRMLLRSLCFAGVAGIITVNPQAKEQQKVNYYSQFFHFLPNNSPLEAHHLALNALADDDTAFFPPAYY